MNKIYNTYKANIEKVKQDYPLAWFVDTESMVKRITKDQLALLESVREMAKEKEITPPSEHGGKFRLEQAYNQGVSSILSAIEQAEQFMKELTKAKIT
jgi:hypothetical protein